jgi:hypothetical protein
MANMTDDKAGRGEAQGSRRPRQQARRSCRVGFSLTGEEYALLEAAAGRAGRATAAYTAEAALTAAQGRSMEQDTLLHELLRELMRASGLVRRIGVNLNQAVAKLNATGQRSGDLAPYAAESFRRGTRRRGRGRGPESSPVTGVMHSAGLGCFPCARNVLRLARGMHSADEERPVARSRRARR